MMHTQIKTEIIFPDDVERTIVNNLADGWSVVAMWDIKSKWEDREFCKTKIVITFGKMPIIQTPIPATL